jgi:hypothetical protein
MGDSTVRLYVKGVKRVTRAKKSGVVTFALPRVGQGEVSPVTFDGDTEAKYEFVLPEEQQKIVEIVQKVASEYGLKLDVIDVARENVLHRAIEKTRSFPALVLDSRERIEGRMTREQIRSILSSTLNSK